MKSHTRIFGLIAVVFIACTNIFSQDNNLFISGAGSFKINLPKSVTSSKDVSFNQGKISGSGKLYTWEKAQEYVYQVQYLKFDTDKKALTLAEKKLFFEPFKVGLTEEAKNKNIPFQEKDYSFNGNAGKEIQFIYPGAKLITRYFIVGKRFYFISAMFNLNLDDSEILKTVDSFSLLDSKSIIEAKLIEATPEPLPQEPVAKKLKSDAQDKNLKGKVKSVIEETQEGKNGIRERNSEEYYNENGNLVKEISYDEGYPSDVTVLGYIDGNRVSSSGHIEFDDDQRPPSRHLKITVLAKDNAMNPNAPRDERYDMKLTYKYNEQGQLTELGNYQNNGELWTRTVYNYKGNQREEKHYGQDGSEYSQTIEILDKDGNVIEKRFMDADGKISNKYIITYEFDSQGNWIVEKTFEPTKVKGKAVNKLLWTSYRTITYHP